MAIGFSAEELKRRLQRTSSLPGKTTQKITQAAAGKASVSTSRAKQIIPKILKNKTKLSREKKYRELDLTYDEKKRLEKIVAGGKSAEQIRKEKERYDILKKRNVAWSRYGRDAESIGGGSADKLIHRRASLADKSHEKREQEARNRVETEAGSIITHEHLDIKNIERERSQTSAHQKKLTASGSAEKRSSISQAGDEAIGVTGVGAARGNLGKKASGKVSNLNNFRNSKLGNTPPPSKGRSDFLNFRKAA